MADEPLLPDPAEPPVTPELQLEEVAEPAWDGPLLTASTLVAGYVPGVDILNGCDLELYPGELVGIIGPNGAGKSTLLKSLFGLVPVRSGSVTLRGTDITSAKAHRLVGLGVGYVPQNNNVFPRLTVREHLQAAFLAFFDNRLANSRNGAGRHGLPAFKLRK